MVGKYSKIKGTTHFRVSFSNHKVMNAETTNFLVLDYLAEISADKLSGDVSRPAWPK